MDINQQREIENRATRLSVTLNMGVDVNGNKVDVSGETFSALREERNDIRYKDVDFAKKLLAWCEKVEAALRGETVEIVAEHVEEVETAPVAPLFGEPLKSKSEFANSFERAYDQVPTNEEYQNYVARWLNDNPTEAIEQSTRQTLETARQQWHDSAPTTDAGKRNREIMLARYAEHGDYVVENTVRFITALNDARREAIREAIGGYDFPIDYAPLPLSDKMEAARRLLDRGIEYARHGHDGNIDGIFELAEIELWQAYVAHVQAKDGEEERWIMS